MATDTQQSIFTSSDRIRQLNDIDKDVAKLLHSAGSAIKALTTKSQEDDALQSLQSTEQQMTDFTTVTSQYFSLLSSIDVRLRRQIYALEEADIIPAEAVAKVDQSSATASFGLGPANLGSSLNVPGSTTQKQVGGNVKSTTAAAGGLGNLDVGWLNSRNDSVGKEMEAELWTKAKEFLEVFEEMENVMEEGALDSSVDRSQG